MNLLEKPKSEKSRLMEVTALHKKELEEEIKSFTQATERILTNALFIGGAMAITFIVVSRLTRSKRKKRRHQTSEKGDDQNEIQEPTSPNILSQIGDIVITQATMLLLEFAKENLSEYLHSRKSSYDNS